MSSGNSDDDSIGAEHASIPENDGIELNLGGYAEAHKNVLQLSDLSKRTVYNV